MPVISIIDLFYFTLSRSKPFSPVCVSYHFTSRETLAIEVTLDVIVSGAGGYRTLVSNDRFIDLTVNFLIF
nr:MAG TPA: hypothetical protein [Caudoviricetes sp.]